MLEFQVTINNIISIFLFSCSNENGKESSSVANKKNYKILNGKNGIKTYLNKNKGSNENMEMKFKEILTINGTDNSRDKNSLFSNVSRMCASTNGDIYLFDENSFTIKKFAKSGKFIRSIGRRDTGPGEFSDEPSLAFLSDTLYATNANSNKIILYNNKGKFVRDILFDIKAPQFIFPTENNKFIALDFSPEMGDGKLVLKSVVVIYDSKFKKLKDLRTD